MAGGEVSLDTEERKALGWEGVDDRGDGKDNGGGVISISLVISLFWPMFSPGEKVVTEPKLGWKSGIVAVHLGKLKLTGFWLHCLNCKGFRPGPLCPSLRILWDSAGDVSLAPRTLQEMGDRLLMGVLNK